MGDYILMKKLLLTLMCMTGILIADANTDWVDKQIEAIKPPRTGVNHASVDSVNNPFVFVYKQTAKTPSKDGSAKKTVKSTRTGPLRLFAVMNDTALISGKWYKANEKVRGYSVAKIEPESVLLTKGKTKKMLFVTSTNSNIKIQTK